MNCQFRVALKVLVASIAAVALFSITVVAQDVTMPRTPWGAPDLQGVWDFRTLTPFERPTNLDEDIYNFERLIDPDNRLVANNGMIKVPNRPGLGVIFNQQAVEKYRIG